MTTPRPILKKITRPPGEDNSGSSALWGRRVRLTSSHSNTSNECSGSFKIQENGIERLEISKANLKQKEQKPAPIYKDSREAAARGHCWPPLLAQPQTSWKGAKSLPHVAMSGATTGCKPAKLCTPQLTVKNAGMLWLCVLVMAPRVRRVGKAQQDMLSLDSIRILLARLTMFSETF